MTPDQMHRAEQHAALMAVTHSLTAAERTLFLGKVARRYPRLDGAGVADVLDLTTDHDMFLDKTEPFYEKFGGHLPEGAGHATILAVHAIIILELELTPARVTCFLQRAGVLEAPRYPEVEVGLWAHADRVQVQSGSIGVRPSDGNHLLLMARAEQGMRAAGIPESEITEFRASVRRTETPGFSRNVADIAKWVTLADKYTEMPRKAYDPMDDLAVVLAWASAEPGDPDYQALDNLRSHLDMRAPETVKASLSPFFGREAR